MRSWTTWWLVAAGLASGLAAAPAPDAPVYEAQVEVHGRAAPITEGLLAIEVSGSGLDTLSAADFELNRGNVDVVAARVVSLQPAIHVLVDTACSDAQDLTRMLAAIARATPAAALRMSLLVPGGGLETVRFDAGGHETTWVRAPALASWLDDGGRSILLPERTWGPADAKGLHEGIIAAARSASELGDLTAPFVLVVTDGSTRTPWADYEIMQNPPLWPYLVRRPHLIEAEEALSRALAAERAHLLVAWCRPQGSEVERNGTWWWRGPKLGLAMLGTIAEASGGAFAGHVGDADASSLVAGRVRDRVAACSQPLWIAWSARDGSAPSFLHVECRREGVRLAANRVEINGDAGPDPVALRRRVGLASLPSGEAALLR